MSTKIYDAYRFDKGYDIQQIDGKMELLRAEIKDHARQMIQSAICTEYAYYYGYHQFHSKDEIQNLMKTAEKRKIEDWSKYGNMYWKRNGNFYI